MKRFSAYTLVLALAIGSTGLLAQNGSNSGNGRQSGFGGGDGLAGNIDQQLRALIVRHDLDGDPVGRRQLPDISDPLPQLGMALFYSKSLGGEYDSACVTCHHPMLGGADALSLSVGVGASLPDFLGQGREPSVGLPQVPRNAPTVFNSGLYTRGLFWDSRVERLRSRNNSIRTPDSDFDEGDPNAGESLLVAQARFPVTSDAEMKTDNFERGASNDVIREHLAGRLGDYGAGEGELGPSVWLDAFQRGFGSTLPPQELITYASIAAALGAYESSMVFVNNPWRRYVEGDMSAITDQQKSGARLFFSATGDGGADCVACHSGDFMTDQNHHNVAFPQFGPGKGDGVDAAGDFGRARETGRGGDRFDFRTPSLLNVAVTAPFGHAGAYSTLREVVQHYQNPRGSVRRFFRRGAACNLQQFENTDNCAQLYPAAEDNSLAAVRNLGTEQNQGRSRLRENNLSNRDVDAIVAFLHALTDPCVEDRDCLAPWIPSVTSSGPDGQQLNGVDQSGSLL